jgi:hypothetical protein
MLRAHPNLSFTGESHFIPSFYKAFGHPRNAGEARRLATRILNLQWIQPWDLSLDPADFVQDRSYASVVRRIFEAWAKKEEKPRWGDKTPQYVMEMPVLLDLFPDCRFIHIIRDGRDVALSWLPLSFGPTNIFTAAERWCHFVSTGQRIGRALPAGTYLEIRYENLIDQPKSVMADICSFIEEPPCEEILTPDPLILRYPPRKPIIGKRAPSYRFALRTDIMNGNAYKWKHEMSRLDAILFESMAGDLLRSLGYETTGEVRRISIPEKAFWKIHHALKWSLTSLNTGGRTRWMRTDWMLRWADFVNRWS